MCIPFMAAVAGQGCCSIFMRGCRRCRQWRRCRVTWCSAAAGARAQALPFGWWWRQPQRLGHGCRPVRERRAQQPDVKGSGGGGGGRGGCRTPAAAVGSVYCTSKGSSHQACSVRRVGTRAFVLRPASWRRAGAPAGFDGTQDSCRSCATCMKCQAGMTCLASISSLTRALHPVASTPGRLATPPLLPDRH